MKEPRIDLGEITQHNIKQLKRLNQVVFPVSYNGHFYDGVKRAGELAKFVYFNDIVVGAVCCRVEKSNGRKRLYIMTLGCLKQYRRYGIGTKMLEHVLCIAQKHGDIDSIYLHVQINNEAAIEFYKHFDFHITEEVPDYYKKISPSNAFVLQRNLNKAATSAERTATGAGNGAN